MLFYYMKEESFQILRSKSTETSIIDSQSFWITLAVKYLLQGFCCIK